MIRKDGWLNAVTVISILIFLVLAALGLVNKIYGFIPDAFIFIGLTLFYYWTYDIWRLNLPIYTLIIIGHILHVCGVFGWYHISPVPIQWDHITHFLGVFPFSLMFFRFFERFMDSKFWTKKNLLLIAAVFLTATGVGAVVEMSEFIGYLTFGFGEGLFMFGPGDGVAGLQGNELIDALGGGWINEGWDFIYNTIGLIVGMIIMISIRVLKPKKPLAYYFERIDGYSKRL